MDWISFGKRLTVSLIICFVLAWVVNFLVFQIWTLASYFLVLLFLGVIMLIFGACLQTPFIEAMATMRYAVNPQSTRDTARHYSDRRVEQASSGVVILVTGVLLLGVGLIGLTILPFLPI